MRRQSTEVSSALIGPIALIGKGFKAIVLNTPFRTHTAGWLAQSESRLLQSDLARIADMVLRKRARKVVSGLSSLIFLFAQAVAIAQVCIAAGATPAMAFEAGMAVQDCHDTMPGAPQPNPNACLQHCNAGDQTTAQIPTAVPALLEVAVLTVPTLAEIAPVSARAEACELHSPDPPPSLRFCSFQL